jgi:hypothetical protein
MVGVRTAAATVTIIADSSSLLELTDFRERRRRRTSALDGVIRSSRPRSGRVSRTPSGSSSAQACPRVHGAPQSAQTCRRGRCLMVRGPSNSQLGRNGRTNMATRAAKPTQGVSTCGIVAPFLWSRLGNESVLAFTAMSPFSASHGQGSWRPRGSVA